MTEITFKGDPVTLEGTTLKVGDKAPEFTAVATDLSEVSSNEYAGKKRLISVVPSLDTGVCSTQTKRFNDAAGEHNVTVLTVSNDLPFAQKRWCGAEGADNVITLSDHKLLDFANKYGVLMPNLRLLARSVFVVDANDEIVYIEIVPEGTNEPDYQKALDALNAL